ncbi:MAG: 5-bromo-4-chloroindolyl phosphate hydrolysis family protein [Oscillospiraceae bacterium]|nr:5-bromo-4-chloroindolyl phosphate hydrolysis family protein [Oscillospiraceae bacterium]
MKFNKKAKNADMIFAGSMIAVTVFSAVFFILWLVVKALGGFFSLFNIGLISQINSFVQVFFLGLIFCSTMCVIAIKAIIRSTNRADKYKDIFARSDGNKRMKISDIVVAMKRPLKVVSADLNVLKKRKYFPEMEFDLDNKEVLMASVIYSEPLTNIGDESETVYTQSKGIPVEAIAAGLITALAFGFGLFTLLLGIGMFFLVLNFFPVPVYFSEEKRKPGTAKKPSATGNSELDSTLMSIFESKKEMLRMNGVIVSPKIRQPLKEILRVLDQISAYVGDNPDKVKMLRQFTNYYLPTTVSFLKTYEELESKPDKGENIAATLSKIEEVTADLVDVFKREYDDLFSDKAMDIEAEAAVMEALIKSVDSGQWTVDS